MEFRKAQEITSYKQKLRQEIQEMIGQEASNEEMIDKCQQHVMASDNTLGDVDVTILVGIRCRWHLSFEPRLHCFSINEVPSLQGN